MKFGFVQPYGDARLSAELAALAERSGWDGFFVWEPVWGFDAWICLSAAAMVTERIRLGTMITPLSRMRPWKLASETITLDHLSGGRVILSVGLGAVDTGFSAFGEVVDRKQRAELLDEGLEILTGLWRGQPFRFDGKHYHVTETDFMPPPPPLQQPRIPIWVVGAWPRQKSMARALRYDGILPSAIQESDGKRQARQANPQEVAQIAAYIQANRSSDAPFDIVVEGVTPGDKPQKARAIVAEWAQVGATWWIEALWNLPNDTDGLMAIRKRIEQGPPAV
jgi:alkanesulfonate monooxygenase SsuD/methylene tetrahydromethanopterin reductase-like flavin-dependent oxidoreductase (luciferase family)